MKVFSGRRLFCSLESVTLEAPEHEHGAMPRSIAAHGCTDVLCGGLGPRAVNMLNQMGILIKTIPPCSTLGRHSHTPIHSCCAGW